MEIRILQDETQWVTMEDEWNDLLGNSISNLPFLRHEYLTAWWEHRGGGEWPDSELYILTGHDDDGALVGIAPLFLSKNHAGAQALMFLGAIEISDFLDVIVKPADHKPFLDSLLNFLISPEAAAWDCLDLYNILDDSVTLDVLEELAGDYKLSYQREVLQPAPYIPLPDDFDEYMASLDKKYRHELRRKMRNAASYPIPTSWAYIDDKAEQEKFLTDFAAMMREEQEKEEFLTDAMLAQMEAIIRAGFKAGWMRFACFYVGGEKAAGYLNFEYDNRVWVYNSGMSRKHRNISPGIVLMGYLIMDAIENGREVFDLMRGDEPYKYHLGGQDRFVVRATLTR